MYYYHSIRQHKINAYFLERSPFQATSTHTHTYIYIYKQIMKRIELLIYQYSRLNQMAEKDHKLSDNNGAKDWENLNKISKIVMPSMRAWLTRDIR